MKPGKIKIPEKAVIEAPEGARTREGLCKYSEKSRGT